MEYGNLNAKIKKYRQINEMTQQEVADRLGVDRTTYSKYESGKANPNFKNIVKLSEIFSISLSELCDSDGTRKFEFGDSALLNTEEARLVYSFRELSERRKQEILRTLNRLMNDQEKEKNA